MPINGYSKCSFKGKRPYSELANYPLLEKTENFFDAVKEEEVCCTCKTLENGRVELCKFCLETEPYIMERED